MRSEHVWGSRKSCLFGGVWRLPAWRGPSSPVPLPSVAGGQVELSQGGLHSGEVPSFTQRASLSPCPVPSLLLWGPHLPPVASCPQNLSPPQHTAHCLAPCTVYPMATLPAPGSPLCPPSSSGSMSGRVVLVNVTVFSVSLPSPLSRPPSLRFFLPAGLCLLHPSRTPTPNHLPKPTPLPLPPTGSETCCLPSDLKAEPWLVLGAARLGFVLFLTYWASMQCCLFVCFL